jgi:hypothetical protein
MGIATIQATRTATSRSCSSPVQRVLRLHGGDQLRAREDRYRDCSAEDPLIARPGRDAAVVEVVELDQEVEDDPEQPEDEGEVDEPVRVVVDGQCRGDERDALRRDREQEDEPLRCARRQPDERAGHDDDPENRGDDPEQQRGVASRGWW